MMIYVLTDGEPPDVPADERVRAGGPGGGSAQRGVGAPLGRVLLLQQHGGVRGVVLTAPHREPGVVIPHVVQATYTNTTTTHIDYKHIYMHTLHMIVYTVKYARPGHLNYTLHAKWH